MQARYLVTAGSTRERIDEVRVWGNLFTGNTGLAIALELAKHGHVDLLTSNPDHVEQVADAAELSCGMTASAFQTHADLRGLLADNMAREKYRAVFMTAAVSDFRPAGVVEIVSRQPLPGGGEQWTVRDVQSPKVKGNYAEIAVRGGRTEKLVDLFRTEGGFGGLRVKFKLEGGIDAERRLEIGRASRAASGADWLVANTLEMTVGPSTGAFLIGPDDQAEFVARSELAGRLARLAMEFPAR